MPNDDPVFSARIRAKPTAPVPVFTNTVGQAIDAINDLPDATRELPHWQMARQLLYAATDAPADPAKVKAAETAYRSALHQERWLN